MLRLTAHQHKRLATVPRNTKIIVKESTIVIKMRIIKYWSTEKVGNNTGKLSEREFKKP
jgi:hypothetical protein